MFVWIIAGYCLAAVIFYSYLVATAEMDPTENSGLAVNAEDNQAILNNRKAA